MKKRVKYESDSKTEWDKRTEGISAETIDDIVFSEVFEKYLPKDKKLRCLEIGSIPGNFLVYFHKKFGYQVNGIDFADNEEVFHQTMKKNGITNYEFTRVDFFKFNPREKYDVVASFGFIEHFDDVKDVIQRHIDLINPGGYLVLTMPNFRFMQHIYHHRFDKPNLDIHNLKAMNLGYLKSVIGDARMTKLFAGYFGNLQVWRQDTELDFKKRKQVNAIHTWISKNGERFPTSRLYSPYIVLIYRKPTALNG